MDPNTLNIIKGAAAGGDGGEGLYVEDVFKTHLYEGDNIARTEDVGIDLSSEGPGGMVWFKDRDSGAGSRLVDTVREETKALESYDTTLEAIETGGLTAFTSTGYSIGTQGHYNDNSMVNWVFRRQPGFFDIVTYNGNDNGNLPAGQTIPHNLGCKPGMILIKCRSHGSDWHVYHKSITATHYLTLNQNYSAIPTAGVFNDTEPTSSVFTVHQGNGVNAIGRTYVAYLFADGDDADAQIFGDAGNESIIKCGSYTPSGVVGSDLQVDCGWEPQYLLVKRSSGTSTVWTNWGIFDNMRGVVTGGNDTPLMANLPNKEGGTNMYGSTPIVEFNANGFLIKTGVTLAGTSSETYVYMAIRRGPMKTPTDATKVFAVDTGNSSSTIPAFDSGFPVDAAFLFNFNNQNIGGYDNILISRLTQQYLKPNSTAIEGTGSGETFDSNVGWARSYDTTYQSLMFQRAPGFMDVVCYTSPGPTPNTQVCNHNLSVEPELIIVKNRDGTYNWVVWQSSLGTSNLSLDNPDGVGIMPGRIEGATPTTFSVSTQGQAGGIATNDYIAYLFASLDGISKVGSKTVTGSSDVEVTCEGFTSGARFVMLKRTDAGTAAGDWYVYDSLRGIGPGNDPYVPLNVSTVQVINTDYIDALTTGFKINSSLPAGTYIYLAIA